MKLNSALSIGLGTLSFFSGLKAVEPVANDLATTPTLFVMNYSHLDDQWRWSYPQSIREFISNTLHANFYYFEKYEHHIFNWTGADRYRLMAEYYPEEFATLKTWIAKGRWVTDGNAWVESDTNVPCSESVIRQMLMGHHYFKQTFGTESVDYTLPDSFGFPASLPSLIAHCGLRGFSTQKLTWKSVVGIPFNVGRWIGPDGRSVIAALNPGDYAKSHTAIYSTDEKMAKRLAENKEKSGLAVDFIYNSRGDRGGAPFEVSLQAMEKAYATPGPVRVVVGPGDAMFRTITDQQAEKFPTYTGELLLTEHSTGTLTSQAYMKRLNRQSELIGNASERAAVAAALVGANPYPSEALYQAWGLALRNQFHDTVPGTSTPKVFEYAWNDDIIALNRFCGVYQDAISALSRGLNTDVNKNGDGVPLVVFNPLAQVREDVIEVLIPKSLQDEAAFTVFSADGKALPTQVVTGFDGKKRILFIGRLPSVGCAVFSLQAKALTVSSELTVSEMSLDNKRYHVFLNNDGDIASIFDKQEQRELLESPIQLNIINNFPEKKPAWHIDWKDVIVPPRSVVQKPTRITVIENGPVRITVECERECENSLFVQRVSLSAGADGERVEIHHRIDWKSANACLKQNFNLRVSNPEATYGFDLGNIQRGNRREKLFEVPNHGWIDLTDTSGSYGVTLLTGAKYGSDKPNDNTIRLTMLHTPGTQEEENEDLDLGKAREQRWMDWGRHEISYGIVGHTGDWRTGQAQVQAQRFEQKPAAFAVPAHPGELGSEFSLMNISNSQVCVQAIKQAESGQGVIVRLQEWQGKPCTGVTLSAVGSISAATECDGIERPLQKLTPTAGTLSLDFTPYQLRTILITIAPGSKAVPATASTALPLPYDCDVFSRNQKRDDGSFDLKRGDTYPAEMIGDTISLSGVTFTIGSRADGQLNALSCAGQTILFPAGTKRLHLLAACEGRKEATFSLGKEKQTLSIGDWAGYMGSWDNRIFIGEIKELTYSLRNELARINPAWIRNDRVAWCASHRHTPAADVIYNYGYLFAYQLDVAASATSITLPKAPAIRILAINAATIDNADAQPLWSCFSDLARDEAFKQRFATP